MNLLSFIDLEISKTPKDKSDSSVKKDSVCRDALAAYIGESGIDIRHTVFSDFLYDFGVFISEKYEKKYSISTNREILRTLRKWIRQAIIQGYVPNIDAIPAVMARLDLEIWHAKSNEKETQYSLRPDLKVKETISKMTRYIDSWAIRQRMGRNAKPADRDERSNLLQTHCAAIYLFCLLTYGLEIKEALAAKCDWEPPEVPDRIYIEKYGVNLPLSQSAKNLVKFYNRGSVCTGHLFYTLDNKKYKDNLDNAAQLIEGHISKYLRKELLPLFKKKCIFIDWLNYAIECGLSDADAETLWKYHLGLECLTSALPAIESAQSKFSGTKTDLEESWYLLCLIPLSIKRDRMHKMLLASGILGEEDEAKLRIYAPEERLRNKAKGEYAVFSRYIFFRATQLQVEFVNSFSQYAYVMKDRTNMRFARIRQQEIEHLREMLRDFQDVVEMKDGKKWLEEHNAEIIKGCKAIIRSGSLAGKEATVVHVKGQGSDKLTFFLEFVEGAIKFQTNLDGVELDIVQE